MKIKKEYSFKEIDTGAEAVKAFGQKLREARQSKGVTLEGIAQRAGLGPNYVSSIERGQYKCNAFTLIAYAEVLDMSIDDIVGHKPTACIIDELKDVLIAMDKDEQAMVLEMIKLGSQLRVCIGGCHD